MFKLIGKKIITILDSKSFHVWTRGTFSHANFSSTDYNESLDIAWFSLESKNFVFNFDVYPGQ